MEDLFCACKHILIINHYTNNVILHMQGRLKQYFRLLLPLLFTYCACAKLRDAVAEQK